MWRMRFLIALLIVWFALFFSVERLSQPVDITETVYALMAAIVIAAIAIPRLHHVPLWLFLGASIPLFLALRISTGYPIWGAALLSTTTEVFAVAVTVIIAHFLMVEVQRCESAITHISISQSDKKPDSFSLGQGVIYREVKRARDYQRPISLMAVGIEDGSIQIALDRLTQELQRATMRQYALASVSKTLCDMFEDYNIIARMNDHFLVLLPEVTAQQLPNLIEHLRQAIAEQVGVTLRVGSASLPEDGLTFDGIMQKAVRGMDATGAQFGQARPTARLNTILRPASEGTPKPTEEDGYAPPSQELIDGFGDH